MLSVSIAMATYNGAKHIRRQLDSLASQSYVPSEIVITDDGSTDDTLSILAEFSREAPFPVHIHRNPQRLGFRENFMRAASLCRSELIAFSDQDDIWYNNKIEMCVGRFGEPDVLLVYHDADVVADDGNKLGSLEEFAASSATIQPMSVDPMSFAPGFTQVFQADLLLHSHLWKSSKDHRSDNELMAHDQWFYFLATVLGKIGYLKQPLVAYVQHGTNTYGYSGKPANRQLRNDLRSPSRLSRITPAMNIRASILDAVSASLDGPKSKRAKVAAEAYRRLASLHETRRQIYISRLFRERLDAFVKLVACRGYGGNWNLSLKSLVKDACVGVPIGTSIS